MNEVKKVKKEVPIYITSDHREFDNEIDAIAHQCNINNIIDKRYNHDFKEGDIVYIAIDYVKPCRIVHIYERIEYYEEPYELENAIDLKDLSRETDYKIDYCFRGKDINKIKRTPEELILPIIHFE